MGAGQNHRASTLRAVVINSRNRACSKASMRIEIGASGRSRTSGSRAGDHTGPGRKIQAPILARRNRQILVAPERVEG